MKQHVIGINTLFMIPNAVGGTEYHLRSFLTHLQNEDTRNFYIVFCNKENYATFHFKNPKWIKVLCPVRATFRLFRILYEQCALPFLIKQYQCDVVHSFGYFGPIVCPAKHIITIHDANWRDCPEDYGNIEQLVTKTLIELNLRFCSRVMVVSEFTKTRLLYYFPWVKKKISVIPSWVSEEFMGEAKKHHIHPLSGKRYILSVGAMYPHKKVPYLLDLWKAILKKDKKLAFVLIGQNGKDEKTVRKLVAQLPRVYYYPKVSLSDLVSFFQHSKMLVSASVYEGFGYSVYEAMACGIPCVVGNKNIYTTHKNNIGQLTFQPTTDSTLVFKQLSTRVHNKKATLSYKNQSISLIKLYNYE